ncbi:MAG TPA: hypothetical protein VJN18_18800 [Polyangiaceae bacterium]|nr:hypothetical protein [Polyangiaceae bacterium]
MPAYEKSVFINCPFDDAFEPLFHAIVLTVAARGFTPRCARESEGQADPRITRIAKGLMDSKYSIHDLTRFQGEGAENLSRFNMPLELGMALGIRHCGQDGTRHNWSALVPADFVHHKFVSDLAGYDIPAHDGQPAAVIRAVGAWLSLQPDFQPPTPTAQSILAAFAQLQQLLAADRAASLGTLTWPAILKHAQAVTSAMPVA